MDYIEKYIEYLTSVKHISANTVICIRRDLKGLLSYISDLGYENLSKITPTVIKSYSNELTACGLSKATVARNVSSIRGFYRFLFEKHYIDEMPIFQLKTGTVKTKMPKVLSEQEIEMLLNAPAGNSPMAVRDRAMLELLYATGIKAAEIVNLKISDVNLDMGFLTCSESSKQRLVPFGNSASHALSEYIGNAREKFIRNGSTDILFLSTHGEAMSRQGFWKLVKKYGKQAGIEKDINCNTIRHSFAKHLIENGADIKSVQEMLGHSSISTTMVYMGDSQKRVREEYIKAHPRK